MWNDLQAHANWFAGLELLIMGDGSWNYVRLDISNMHLIYSFLL